MKDETIDSTRPSEAELNDMYRNEWLNFYADAQEAKQELNRTYSNMLKTFGSYKKMPDGVKEILKQKYSDHDVKWGENGQEMEKRFGKSEPDNKKKAAVQDPIKEETTKEKFATNKEDITKEAQARAEFIRQMKEAQERKKDRELSI